MASKLVYGGIDPGKAGVICLMYESGKVEHHQIPLLNKDYDQVALANFFRNLKGVYSRKRIHFVLEDVNCDPNWGAKQNWSMGGCIHLFKQIFACYRIPFTLVHAKTWQKEMHQGVKPIFKPLTAVQKKANRVNGAKDVKAMSIAAAMRLFPDIDFRKSTRCKNLDDNKVDATLLALYGKRHF